MADSFYQDSSLRFTHLLMQVEVKAKTYNVSFEWSVKTSVKHFST